MCDQTEEINVLIRILPYYYEHILKNPNSLLARIFGVYKLGLQSNADVFVFVMGNVLDSPKKLHEKFDLKVGLCKTKNI